MSEAGKPGGFRLRILDFGMRIEGAKSGEQRAECKGRRAWGIETDKKADDRGQMSDDGRQRTEDR